MDVGSLLPCSMNGHSFFSNFYMGFPVGRFKAWVPALRESGSPSQPKNSRVYAIVTIPPCLRTRVSFCNCFVVSLSFPSHIFKTLDSSWGACGPPIASWSEPFPPFSPLCLSPSRIPPSSPTPPFFCGENAAFNAPRY